MPINRRGFLLASGGMSFVFVQNPSSESSPTPRQSGAVDSQSTPDVTRTLARHVISATYADLPAGIRKEAVRTLLNWVGCTLGGSHHETVDIAISALAPFSGPPQSSVLGRKERLDILHTALVNGISSHVLDFDDTHPKTRIHPAGPVVSAILALSEQRPTTGRDFINALALGVEVECRIGNAVHPHIPDITTQGGISPARRVSLARQRRRESCLVYRSSSWCGPSGWPRRSRSASRRCSER